MNLNLNLNLEDNMKEIKGNLFKHINEFDVVIHGCNCFSKMGAGFAKQIREKYPIAYEVDKNSSLSPNSKLGKITHTGHLTTPTIVNAYTQLNWQGKNNIDYDAVKSSMKHVKSNFAGKKMVMPLIGAGLAGGDWNIIKKIIEDELAGEDVTVVIYEDEKDATISTTQGHTTPTNVGTDSNKTDEIKLNDLIDDFESGQ